MAGEIEVHVDIQMDREREVHVDIQIERERGKCRYINGWREIVRDRQSQRQIERQRQVEIDRLSEREGGRQVERESLALLVFLCDIEDVFERLWRVCMSEQLGQ